jgi:hypothetical protein
MLPTLEKRPKHILSKNNQLESEINDPEHETSDAKFPKPSTNSAKMTFFILNTDKTTLNIIRIPKYFDLSILYSSLSRTPYEK